jgi:hypothetical protein
LEAQFLRWKKRHSKSQLAKAHDDLPDPIPEEEMKAILTAFCTTTKNTGGQEILSSNHTDSVINKDVTGKRYVDYYRVCLHYRLEPVDITLDCQTPFNFCKPRV